MYILRIKSSKIQFPRLSTSVESLGNHFFEEFQKSMHYWDPVRHGGLHWGGVFFAVLISFEASLMFPQADFKPEVHCAAR